jgi:mannose-6-phosphate isomerase class I
MNKSQSVKVIVDKPRRKMKDDSLTAKIINAVMHFQLFQGFLELIEKNISEISIGVSLKKKKRKCFCLREWLR